MLLYATSTQVLCFYLLLRLRARGPYINFIIFLVMLLYATSTQVLCFYLLLRLSARGPYINIIIFFVMLLYATSYTGPMFLPSALIGATRWSLEIRECFQKMLLYRYRLLLLLCGARGLLMLLCGLLLLVCGARGFLMLLCGARGLLMLLCALLFALVYFECFSFFVFIWNLSVFISRWGVCARGLCYLCTPVTQALVYLN